jgi:putative ABC transport system permease protein
MRSAFDGLLRDLGLAARRLLATPLFLIFAVASISIGIATTTAAYSILHATLWKPLGINQPDDVVTIGNRSVAGTAVHWRSAISREDFDLVSARLQTLDDMAAATTGTYAMVTPSSSESAIFETVSGRFFRTIRVQAARGRTIQPEDDAQRAQVLVLNDATWRRRFASDPEIVGKTVRISGRPFEIIGVAPASFDGLMLPTASVAGWIPLSTSAALTTLPTASNWPSLAVLGRLATGRTLAAASSELDAVRAALEVEVPTREITRENGSKLRFPRAWTLRRVVEADEDANTFKVALLLFALVALVLVVACTNLGNLTLSRGTYRQHELAVRRALGATRWRLVRELFAETAVIGVLAGVCTIALTRVLLMLATFDVPTHSGTISFAPELSTSAALVSTLALTISMLVFGLEPAFALTGRRAAASLAEGAATFGAGRNARQRAFIRWQVAISVCFFLIAATIVRVVARVSTHDSGIPIHELAIASIGAASHTTDDQIRRALTRGAEIARQRADLTSVAIANGMPYGISMTPFARMTIQDGPPKTGPNDSTGMISASPEIFRTLGMAIMRGRQFDDRDSISTAHVTVINELTATQLFGSLDAAMGKTIRLQPWARGEYVPFTVIGVVQQTDTGSVMSRRGRLVFVPLHEGFSRYYALVARTTGRPAGAARALQDALRTADPDVGTGMSGPAEWLVATSYVVGRLVAALAGGLGLLTLTLAMIGLYGVQVQTVVFRTREMGIRMALGAAAAQIKSMVLRDGIRPVIEGVALGFLFAAVTRGLIRALLDERVQIIDPAVFASVPIPFAIAALIACYLPARRAARVDPNVALRHL